jgi:hypothetical protein
MKPLIAAIAALLVLPSQAAKNEKDDKKLKSLDEMLFDEGLWSKSLEDLKGPEPEKDESEEALRKKLKEKGIEMGKGNVEGFSWLSSAKDGMRADPKEFKLLGEVVGEVVIRGRDGKPTDATVSVFNRGDDGEVPFELLAAPRGAPDDLSKLTGMGPQLVKKLNDAGMFHYWQVAAMTPEDMIKVDADLKLNVRIDRDGWVNQARSLLSA